MKNRLLAAALAAGALLSPAAQAELRLSADGMGDAVYVPYYTVEQGQTSLLTVSNSAPVTTAVQVLFAESRNGQNVMSFSVVLAPGATWSAAIVGDGDGARLESSSQVCTVPVLSTVDRRLRTFDYEFNYPDAGPADRSRTRTGAVEILEIGEVRGPLATLGCGELVNAVSGGWTPDVVSQFRSPWGKVSASINVVQVAQGVIFQVPGIALRGYSDRPLVGAGWAAIGSSEDPFRRLANPMLPNGATEFSVQTVSQRLRVPASRAPDAMSLLFMQYSLSGQFYTSPALGAETRWVVSFPTKHAYVHARPGSLMTGGSAVAPFSSAFGADGACETVDAPASSLSGGALRDAELPLGDELPLCGQVNLLAFPRTSVDEGGVGLLLVDSPARAIDVRDDTGVARRVAGLPAIGLQLNTFVNGQAQPGVLANYSVSAPLRALGALAQ